MVPRGEHFYQVSLGCSGLVAFEARKYAILSYECHGSCALYLHHIGLTYISTRWNGVKVEILSKDDNSGPP